MICYLQIDAKNLNETAKHICMFVFSLPSVSQEITIATHHMK